MEFSNVEFTEFVEFNFGKVNSSISFLNIVTTILSFVYPLISFSK